MVIAKLRRLVSHNYSAKLAEKLIDAVEELESEVKRLQSELRGQLVEAGSKAHDAAQDAHDAAQGFTAQFQDSLDKARSEPDPIMDLNTPTEAEDE